MLERERKIAIRLLITGSGVRVPHNPLLGLKAFELNQLINLSLGDNQSVTFCTPWGDLF